MSSFLFSVYGPKKCKCIRLLHSNQTTQTMRMMFLADAARSPHTRDCMHITTTKQHGNNLEHIRIYFPYAVYVIMCVSCVGLCVCVFVYVRKKNNCNISAKPRVVVMIDFALYVFASSIVVRCSSVYIYFRRFILFNDASFRCISTFKSFLRHAQGRHANTQKRMITNASIHEVGIVR